MLTTLRERELVPFGAEPELVDVFLDWAAANEDIVAGANPFDAPRIAPEVRGRLRDETSRILVDAGGHLLRLRVQDVDAIVDVLAQRQPAQSEEPTSRLLLWQRLVVACASNLTANAGLVLADEDRHARDLIRRGYRAHLRSVARGLEELGIALGPTPAASTATAIANLDADEVEILLRATSGRQTGYRHTNSKDVTYFLNSKKVTLRGGKVQTIYYFSKEAREATATDLPADRTVNENPRNGFLTLKRK
jgi:hypothetical protein